MQAQNAPARDRHVYGLDLLRCIAAVLVACFHFTRNLEGPNHAFSFGWVGVEIFFLISGCVIAYSAHRSNASRFLKSRVLRLYPAAWIVAAMSAAIVIVVPGYYWHSIQVNVFTDPASIVNSLLLTGIGFSGSYWTLPIELSFYFCVFTLLLAGRVRWLGKFGVALIALSAPYMLLLALDQLQITQMPYLEFGLSGWNALLLRHGPFFALGLFLFMASQRRLRTGERFICGVAILLATVEIACRAIQQLHTHSISQTVSLPVLIAQAEIAFILAIAAMAAALRWNHAFPLRLRRLSRALGLATYPFYLAHEVVGGLTMFLLFRMGADPMAATLGAVIVVFAVAYVISSRIEPTLRRGLAASLVRRPAAEPVAANLGAT